MAELRDIRCDWGGCQERPLYALVLLNGVPRGTYCAEHAKRRLEMIQRYEDSYMRGTGNVQSASAMTGQLLN